MTLLLVSEENKLHIRLHVFSRPFHGQTFLPRCRRRSFNHTFVKSHSHEDTFACGFCYIWQPRFFKDPFTCCSRHSIDSYIALTLILNERSFLVEGFFKNLVTVKTWRIILLSIDLFVVPFAISFIIRAFSPLLHFFHVRYCLTNYKTNSVGHPSEKRLNFEIT